MSGASFGVDLFYTHIVEDETVDVGLFLQYLGKWLAATVPRLGIDADEYGIWPRLALLQGSSKLKRVGRNHAVVVIGSGDEGGRVGRTMLQIM